MPRALRSRGAAAVALFLVLAACTVPSAGLRASRDAAITGDEPFYLLTTQSLLQDGDLDLRQQYDRFSYRAFFDHPEPLWRQSRPLPDGRLLSPHGVGLSVYLLPGFAAGGLLGAQVQMLLTAALCLALTFLLTASVTGRARIAWAASMAIGLSAPLFVYATEIYPEVPAALCIVAALLLLRGERPSTAVIVATVALVSALAWLGPKYVPLGVVLALYATWRAARPQRVVFVALATLSGALYLAWHVWQYGALTPYSVNLIYFGEPTVEVAQSHLAFAERGYRLAGLLVDRQFGVGRWAPVLLPAVAALPLLVRRGRIGTVVAALIVVQLLMATFVAITMRGWWFPGRTLVAVLPLLAVPLTECCALTGRRGAAVAGALAAYGLLVTAQLALAAAAHEVRIAVDPFALDAMLFRAAAPLFPDYQEWGAHTVIAHLAWIVLWAAGAAGLWRLDTRRLVLERGERALDRSGPVSSGRPSAPSRS